MYVRNRDDYYGDSIGKVEHNISLDTLSRSKSSSTDLVQILRNWACFTVLFEEHEFSLYWSCNFKSRICLTWIISNYMRWSTNLIEELSRGSSNSSYAPSAIQYDMGLWARTNERFDWLNFKLSNFMIYDSYLCFDQECQIVKTNQ